MSLSDVRGAGGNEKGLHAVGLVLLSEQLFLTPLTLVISDWGRSLCTDSRLNKQGREKGRRATGEREIGRMATGGDRGVLPPKLLFMLAGTGVESVEEGPNVTLDTFELL